MSESKTSTCEKCGTPLIQIGQKYNGTARYDGTSTYHADMVCPKCHPELVKEKD